MFCPISPGLVVTPFLPGDSLLFACGALCALGSLDIMPTLAIFTVAAILGDAVNYAIGHFVGAKVFVQPFCRLVALFNIDRNLFLNVASATP